MTSTKKCTRCHEIKEKRKGDGYASWCKSCSSEYNKQYRFENKEKLKAKAKKKYDPVSRRERTLVENYGLTSETYATMLKVHQGKCWCCLDKTASVVDHCHITGKVRGILCNSCNLGIGLLGDDLNSLCKAIRYLTEHAP